MNLRSCLWVVFVLWLSGIAFCEICGAESQQQQRTDGQNGLVMLAKIAAAGASGRFHTAEQLFAQGKAAGLSELQMYEAVLNLLPYTGYPCTISTMTRFQKVYPSYIRERSGENPQPTEPWRGYGIEPWGNEGGRLNSGEGLLVQARKNSLGN